MDSLTASSQEESLQAVIPLLTEGQHEEALPFLEEFSSQHEREPVWKYLRALSLACLARGTESLELLRGVAIAPDFPSRFGLSPELVAQGAKSSLSHLLFETTVDPTDEEPWNVLTEFAQLLGNKDFEGQAVLGKFKAKPEDSQTIEQFRLFHQDTEKKQIISLIEEVLAEHEDASRPRALLGSYLQEMGKTALAIRHLKTALEKDPGAAEAHLYLGRIYSAQSRYEEAEKEFLTAMDGSAGASAELLSELAVCQKATYRYDEAFETLLKALKQAPQEFKAWSDLSEISEATGGEQKTLEALKSALDAAPGLTSIRVRYARKLLTSGDPLAAQTLLDAAPDPQGGQADSQLALLASTVSLQLGSAKEAVAQLEREISRHPEDPKLRLAYGESLLAASRPAEAETVLKETALGNPNDRTLQLAWGRALLANNDPERAHRAFGLASRLDPGDPEALAEQGRALLALERFNEASSVLKESARKGDPSLPVTLTGLGFIYEKKGLRDIARDFYRQSLAAPMPSADAAQGWLRTHSDESQELVAGAKELFEAKGGDFAKAQLFLTLLKASFLEENADAARTLRSEIHPGLSTSLSPSYQEYLSKTEAASLPELAVELENAGELESVRTIWRYAVTSSLASLSQKATSELVRLDTVEAQIAVPEAPAAEATVQAPAEELPLPSAPPVEPMAAEGDDPLLSLLSSTLPVTSTEESLPAEVAEESSAPAEVLFSEPPSETASGLFAEEQSPTEKTEDVALFSDFPIAEQAPAVLPTESPEEVATTNPESLFAETTATPAEEPVATPPTSLDAQLHDILGESAPVATPDTLSPEPTPEVVPPTPAVPEVIVPAEPEAPVVVAAPEVVAPAEPVAPVVAAIPEVVVPAEPEAPVVATAPDVVSPVEPAEPVVVAEPEVGIPAEPEAPVVATAPDVVSPVEPAEPVVVAEPEVGIPAEPEAPVVAPAPDVVSPVEPAAPVAEAEPDAATSNIIAPTPPSAPALASSETELREELLPIPMAVDFDPQTRRQLHFHEALAQTATGASTTESLAHILIQSSLSHEPPDPGSLDDGAGTTQSFQSALLQSAEQLESQKQFRAASRVLRTALLYDPSSEAVSAALLRVQITWTAWLTEHKEFAHAVSLLRDAIGRQPQNQEIEAHLEAVYSTWMTWSEQQGDPAARDLLSVYLNQERASLTKLRAAWQGQRAATPTAQQSPPPVEAQTQQVSTSVPVAEALPVSTEPVAAPLPAPEPIQETIEEAPLEDYAAELSLQLDLPTDVEPALADVEMEPVGAAPVAATADPVVTPAAESVAVAAEPLATPPEPLAAGEDTPALTEEPVATTITPEPVVAPPDVDVAPASAEPSPPVAEPIAEVPAETAVQPVTEEVSNPEVAAPMVEPEATPQVADTEAPAEAGASDSAAVASPSAAEAASFSSKEEAWEALLADPANSSVLEGVFVAYSDTMRELTSALRDRVTSDAEQPLWLLLLARAFRKSGSETMAVIQYQKYIKAAPSPEAYEELASTYDQIGKEDFASMTRRKADRAFPPA